MTNTSLEKQELKNGLFAVLGTVLLGLYGPWLFHGLGLNVPEASALGSLIGAVVGYGGGHFFLRRNAATAVPEITHPDVTAGLDDLRTSGTRGTDRGLGSQNVELTRQRIEEAFTRLAEHDADNIQVEVRNTKVVLKGTVHSWQDEAEAERIAFDMPGVQEVDNQLEVVR